MNFRVRIRERLSRYRTRFGSQKNFFAIALTQHLREMPHRHIRHKPLILVVIQAPELRLQALESKAREIGGIQTTPQTWLPAELRRSTMEFTNSHWACDDLIHFAERPFPVEAIVPSFFITRSIMRTVSRETPAHAASMSEIEKGVRRASTASRTCFVLAPRPRRTSPTRSSNSRYARSKTPQK